MRLRALVAMIGLAVSSAAALGPDWVGKPAPSFSLKTIEGDKSLSLADLKGQVVVLDFWASWCAPCRRALPHMATIQAYNKGVQVVAVNIDDDRSNGIDFLKRNRVRVIALYDAQKSVAERYDVSAMPSALIIDRRGIVRYVHVGYTDEDLDQVEKEIKTLLQEKA